MTRVIRLNVILQSVISVSVVMTNVILLTVVAPKSMILQISQQISFPLMYKLAKRMELASQVETC
jgi:hypothetical protein